MIDSFVDNVINGASLRVFLIPNPSIPENLPEYMETYELPHVVINGNALWGKTSRENHLSIIHINNRVNYTTSSFCYTNIAPVFCNYAKTREHTGDTVIMNQKRYSVLEWITANDSELIWDSERDDNTDAVKTALLRGAIFKVVMQDEEGIWNIHPVDLCFYYKDNKQFLIKTYVDTYPVFFRSPEQTREIASWFFKKILDNDPLNAHPTKQFPIPIVYAFYAISSDGTYQGLSEYLCNKPGKRYNRLKVFVKLPLPLITKEESKRRDF
ncbi:MAG: hypothetical protein A4E53_00085 [Pelotomaculum sp. PtaB.Bin104]|nr:MAG: hypothetical protein A4E53_00085 [Pelotomaculum sp. PtaB.Bin104]